MASYTLHLERYGSRYWAVYDGGTLVCVCVYKRGAREVLRRLEQGRQTIMAPNSHDHGPQ